MAETCREYREYIIKYFVNCCGKEGIIIYSLTLVDVAHCGTRELHKPNAELAFKKIIKFLHTLYEFILNNNSNSLQKSLLIYNTLL
jgi:hypothetical protein